MRIMLLTACGCRRYTEIYTDSPIIGVAVPRTPLNLCRPGDPELKPMLRRDFMYWGNHTRRMKYPIYEEVLKDA